MKARVHITLKSGVLDPQGKAIGHALASLGFAGVNDVRQGKVIEFDLVETDKVRAEAVAAAPRAARVRVWHVMSRGWDPWTERSLPEGPSCCLSSRRCPQSFLSDPGVPAVMEVAKSCP